MKRIFAYIGITIAAIWVSLGFSFLVKRQSCTPLFEKKCIEEIWGRFGDFLLFEWVGDKGAFFIGILALAAAATSALLVYRQIQQSERHENKRRVNKYESIRSQLAIHLNILSNYIDQNIKEIQLKVDEFECDGIIVDYIYRIHVPDMPNNSIEFLSSVIEYSDQDIRIIYVLIGLIQIQDARMRRYKDGCDPLNVSTISLNEYILQFYIMRQVVMDLYFYARRQVDIIPTSVKWLDVIGAMEFGGETLMDHEGAIDIAKLRCEKQGIFVEFPF